MINLQKPLGHRDDCDCDDCRDYRGFLIGQAALQVMRQSKQASKTCAGCGGKISVESSFCPMCGAKVVK